VAKYLPLCLTYGNGKWGDGRGEGKALLTVARSPLKEIPGYKATVKTQGTNSVIPVVCAHILSATYIKLKYGAAT